MMGEANDTAEALNDVTDTPNSGGKKRDHTFISDSEASEKAISPTSKNKVTNRRTNKKQKIKGKAGSAKTDSVFELIDDTFHSKITKLTASR